LPCILIFTLSRQVSELFEPVRYPDDEMLKEAVQMDRQNISILVELAAGQKNVANALNSVGIILKNKV